MDSSTPNAQHPVPRSGGRRYTTISIPQQLYEDVKKAIDGTGFRSPTEYLVYITRLSLQAPAADAAAPSAPASPFAPPRPRTVPYR